MPNTNTGQSNGPTEQHWQMDRRVPISLISAIVIQSATILWWASKMDSRVEQLERTDARTELLITQRMKMTDERYETLSRDRDRVIRLEEQIKNMLDIVRRIETRIEKAVLTTPRQER